MTGTLLNVLAILLGGTLGSLLGDRLPPRLRETVVQGMALVVLVSGFGKFCVRQKRERRGRNPATGDSMVLAPRRVVTFKWSGRLRDKINGGPATEEDGS